MQLHPGLFLYSTPVLDDTYFAGTVIYLAEYNSEGAVGFVVNRPLGRSLHELEEFKHSPNFPLYEGGPVDGEHLYVLHRHGESIAGSTSAGGGIYLGGDFRQVVTGINNRSLGASDVKLFVGYCGWDAGELEAEVAEGSWEVREAGTVFEVGGL